MVEGRVAIRDPASSCGAAPPPAPLPTSARRGAMFQQASRSQRGLGIGVGCGSTLGLLLAIVVSAATGSIVTFAATHNDDAMRRGNHPLRQQRRRPHRQHRNSARPMRLRQKLTCARFLMCQSRPAGARRLRVEGNLNLPVALRAVTAHLAVQNALVPAVPADVARQLRKYISTTLDVTTAAMGNTPTT